MIVLALVACSSAQHASAPPAPPAVELHEPDGTVLTASYFTAGKPGPGVVLFHQGNRHRESWDVLARQLAAAGIHVLAVDHRGGPPPADWKAVRAQDVDAAFQYLTAQPGVDRDRIGAGGAGWLGVDHAVEMARRHPEVKSLFAMSGETMLPGLEFMRHATQLPGLYVVSDEDEYPPTVEAMEMLYLASASPSKRLIHYVATREAPWLWYETSDPAKVPAHGQHGTDLFETHPDLVSIAADWFVTTLVTTPGHAPADTLASGAVLHDLETPGGVDRVRTALLDARKLDPHAQLFPEVSEEIVGADHLRESEPDAAMAIWELNALAYPDSADAHSDLAEAYLQLGRLDDARREAEHGLALFRAHEHPASSWSDTPQRRGEVEKSLDDVLQRVTAASSSAPKGSFRDCPDCPEMIVLPAGSFTMGSPPADQAYAVGHGGTQYAVADEAPPHPVAVRSFALGVNDVTRGQYAAFVRETGHSTGDRCAVTSMPHAEVRATSWRDPGFAQTDDDPVVCISWYDAQAYVAWLAKKTHAAYRLPSEAEWEYAARGGTTTRFWWGSDDGPAGSDAWYKDNAGGHTHPVGTRPANPFGLHDIVGDVWQWTQDCYTESYAGAPSDSLPHPWIAGCMRVDRGGSWAYPAWLLRSATRERNPPEVRDALMGVRVARSLP
jgi:formylglycine-generating enzyme required for sulfatase activity/dienelactone hydrolase